MKNYYKYDEQDKYLVSLILFGIEINTMKLFQCIQRSLRMLGVDPPQYNKKTTFNLKNTIIFCTVVMATSLITSSLFEAKSIRETGDCFYASMTDIANIFYSYSIISNAPSIYKFMYEVDGFIQKSMFRC